MFLSNPRKSFLLAGFCTLIFQACGSSPGNETKPVPLVVETRSEFPFSTKDPEVYQGELVIDGRVENRRVIARGGDKWRLDYFRKGTLFMTQLKTDKLYLIDHKKKIYAAGDTGASLADSTFNFFNGKEYREFDDLGRVGTLRKYKVREGFSRDDVFIYIDEASGMMVKQEFKSRDTDPPATFVFEIRSLKLEVDDSQFTIPGDYRKVTWDEYRKGITQ